jgi:hypothetical protein
MVTTPASHLVVVAVDLTMVLNRMREHRSEGGDLTQESGIEVGDTDGEEVSLVIESLKGSIGLTPSAKGVDARLTMHPRDGRVAPGR